MDVTQVPETHVMDANPTPDAAIKSFSGNPGDFAADIAKIAQELGQSNPLQQTQAQAPAPEERSEPQPQAPVQPETPQEGQPQATEQAPVEVPKKFQTKDGQLDETKLAKSTQDAESALQRYRQMESELKRKQQEVKKLQAGVPQAQTQEQAQPSSFEAQIEADLQKHGVGKTLSKLFDAARQSAYEQARNDLEGVAEEIEWGKRQRDLENIGKSDPWVFSEEGAKTLGKIIEDRPWLQGSPRKWTDAYEVYLGQRARQQMNGSQVQTPIPTAPTAKAPASPVGAVNRSQSLKVDVNDPAALNKALDRMSAKEQEAFWDKMIPGRRK